MRLAFVIYSLGQGGAERVLVTMANWWVQNGADVVVLTLAADADSAYSLDDAVLVRSLGVSGGSDSFLDSVVGNCKRISAIRFALKEIRPDAVVGFMNTTNILVALASRGIAPALLGEHTHPVMFPLSPLWKLLQRMAYPLAEAVVVQSAEVVECYPKLVRRKMSVIANPIEAPAVDADEGFRDGKVIVSMGRFASEKRFDLMIRAFSQVAPAYPDWRLRILGDGPERPALNSLALQLGIDDRVEMPGWRRDVGPDLLEGGIFALSSEYEGFGNALAEAMSVGLPAVAIDCPSGPRQIICDGVNGILVEDTGVDSLAHGLDRLMGDENLRKRMGEAARKVMDRFGVEKVMPQWETLLATL